jgi:translocation and assembly module TamA
MKRICKNLFLLLVLNVSFVPLVSHADVVIRGLQGKAKDNVLLLLSLNQETCAAPQWKIHKLFAKADAEIDRSLRPLGYYNATVKKNLTFKSNCWLAEFTVQLGDAVMIESIRVHIEGDAKTNADFLALEKKFQTKIGTPLQHSFYESIKTRFIALAQEQGYLHARWKDKKLWIDKENNQADIQLVLDSGIRQRFGEVNIQQQVLDPELVRKYSSITPEAFYGGHKLVETYEALSKSGYFEQIDIRPDFEHASNQRVPVAINLTPKVKHHYSVGLGYGTDVGVLLNAAYENRRLNEDGDTFSAILDVSMVLSTLETQYTMPFSDNPLTDSFTLGAGLKREKTDNFTSQSATITNRLKYALSEGWKQTLSADFSYEKFNIQQQNKQSLLLILGGSWLHTQSNNALRPTEGSRLRLDVNGSYETPLSNVSFVRANLEGVWMQPLPWAGVLTGRANLGAMTINKFANLPTSYRFYAGGINSVRGYKYKELGPRDAFGNVVGGKFLSVVSLEYEHTVFDDWGIAAFVDSGNAFNLNNISVKTGIGLGLRWYSPVGPVRIDFALPLNDAKSGYQIYFAAGARL